jgi:alpha-N-arabinofuranosidase
MARLARGRILRLAVSASQIATKRYGDVDSVDAAATFDEETGRIVLFVANRSLESSNDLTVDLRGFGDVRVVNAETLTIPEGGDRHTANLEASPDTVHMVPLTAEVADGAVRASLPALSWSVIELG